MSTPLVKPQPPTERQTVHRVPWEERYDLMKSYLGVIGSSLPRVHPDDPTLYCYKVTIVGEGCRDVEGLWMYDTAVVTAFYSEPPKVAL